MQAYFDERALFDQASAILDSNSEEAWGETKMHPGGVGVRMKGEVKGEGEGKDKTLNTFTAGF